MASPRRALAPLDANKPSPSPAKLKSPTKNLLGADLLSKQRPVLSHISPAKERKRALEAEERVAKRSCVEGSPRSVTGNVTVDSISPGAPSVFDADSTQTTAPSLEGDRQRAQARKMAGDLRARLRLAKYKVRTGQTHVPFPQLEAQVPRVRVWSPPRETGPESAEGNDDGDRSRDAERDEGGDVPRAERPPAAVAPARGVQEEEPPSSALGGGAASGLLRLSQGSP